MALKPLIAVTGMPDPIFNGLYYQSSSTLYYHLTNGIDLSIRYQTDRWKFVYRNASPVYTNFVSVQCQSTDSPDEVAWESFVACPYVEVAGIETPFEDNGRYYFYWTDEYDVRYRNIYYLVYNYYAEIRSDFDGQQWDLYDDDWGWVIATAPDDNGDVAPPTTGWSAVSGIFEPGGLVVTPAAITTIQPVVTDVAIDINTPQELAAIRTNNYTVAANYVQTGDIDLQGISWIPIGNQTYPFTGTYNGKDFIIRNLSITSPGIPYMGLFGLVKGLLQNIHLDTAVLSVPFLIPPTADIGALCGKSQLTSGQNAMINCSGKNISITVGATANNARCGGLVGMLDYLAEGCYVENVTLSNGSTHANSVGGGFIGIHNSAPSIPSALRRCYAKDVQVTSVNAGGFEGVPEHAAIIEDCYVAGTAIVTGSAYAGGFAAMTYWTAGTGIFIRRCYAVCQVAGAAANKKAFLGGTMGGNVTLSGCLYDADVAGSVSDDTPGVAGKSTALMQTKATFTDAGWNFTMVWDMATGYPFLNPRQAAVILAALFASLYRKR